MSGSVFCTIVDSSMYIILVQDAAENFFAYRALHPKSEPIISLEEFFETDDLTIPPVAKEAIRELLDKEATQKDDLRAKIRVYGKMYPSTKAYFDDRFNNAIDAVLKHPKFKEKVERST